MTEAPLAYVALAAEVQREDATLSFQFAREALRVYDSSLAPASVSALVLARVQESMFALVWVRKLAKAGEGPFHRAVWSRNGEYVALLGFAGGSRSKLFTAEGDDVCTFPGSNAVAFSADSKTFAVGRVNGKVSVASLDASPPTWRVIPLPEGEPARVIYGLSYSPKIEGRLLISYVGTRAVLLDPEGYSPVFGEKKSKQIWATSAFLPDGRFVACGSLWSADGKKERPLLGVLDSSREVDLVEFISVSKDRFLTTSKSGRLRIFDHTGRRCGERDYPKLPYDIASAVFSPDGENILVTTYRGRVEFLAKDGRLVWSGSTPSGRTVMHGHFLGDGTGILVGDWGGIVHKWTLDGMPTGWQVAHHGGVKWIAGSPTSEKIVTAGFHDARLWDPGRDLGVRIHRDLGWSSVAVAPGASDRIVIASESGRILMLDNDGRLLRETSASAGGYHFAKLTVDGKTAIIGGGAGDVLMWDVATGKETPLSCPKGFGAEPVFLGGNKVAFITGDRRCFLWNPTKPLDATPLGLGTAIAGSRDESLLVVGDVYSRLTFWTSEADKPIAALRPKVGAIQSLGLNRKKDRILVGSGDTKAYLVDRASGKVLRTFSGHQGGVTHVGFSPDEQRIATSSDDTTIRIWDAGTGEPQLILRGHRKSAKRIAFVSDNRIVSSSADGTVRFWHLDHAGLAAAVEAVQIPELTDEERRRYEALIR